MDERNQNSPSRRDFLKKSSLAGIGLTTALLSSCSDEAKAEKENKELGNVNDSSKMLMSNTQYFKQPQVVRI